jgi:predicted dienelactone hydrolase
MPRNNFHRPKILALLASIFFCCTISAAKEQENTYTDIAGPHKVATLSEVWTDPVRDREVPVKIYYPEDAGPFPVIVFSHGLGGSRQGYEYLGRHWASYGYVSVHLQHKGSDDKVWKGKIRPMDSLREAIKDPANSANRPRDVRFAVDQLEKLNRETPPLKDKLDMKRLGMAGHSYGAWTTLAIAGEEVAGSAGRESKFSDPRFKAAIAMSAPAPAVKQKEGLDRAFAGVKIPVMHMTGTLDDSPIGETSAAQRRVPFDHISGVDQYLIIFNGGDHMVFSGRGLMPGNFRKDATFQKYILTASTAFWDAFLKDNATAKSWLSGGDFEKSLGKEGTFDKKTK